MWKRKEGKSSRKKAKAVESQEKEGESGRKGGFEVKQDVLKEGYNFGSAMHGNSSEILVLVKYLIHDSRLVVLYYYRYWKFQT